VFILRALGHEPPQFAHLPFVAEPGSKVKLSKRKLDKYLKNRDFAELMELGQKIAEKIRYSAVSELFNPVVVDFYKVVGFLPEAIVNYLALLGWSLDDRTEHFTRNELIQAFSLERVNKAPASFDPKKLMAFQQRHMKELPLDEKVSMVIPYLQQAGWIEEPISPPLRQRIADVVTAAGDRLRVAGEILNYPEFFLSDDQINYDPKDVQKRLSGTEVGPRLEALASLFETLETFTPESLESAIHRFAESQAIALGEVIHPLRVAVTGRSVGLGLFETLAILGRETVCRRLRLARQRFCQPATQ